MIHLTPAMLEAAYELLRTTPPFRGWKLPEPDDVVFIVSRHKDCFAVYEDSPDTITVSQRKHNQIGTLVATMAHEMIHLRMQLTGHGRAPDHGAMFNRYANQVCKYHGFDRGSF